MYHATSPPPSSDELVVELFDGSIIKACQYEKIPFGMFVYQARSCNEKYEELNKVVNDYLKYAQAINGCHNNFGKTVKEIEAELEAN